MFIFTIIILFINIFFISIVFIIVTSNPFTTIDVNIHFIIQSQ